MYSLHVTTNYTDTEYEEDAGKFFASDLCREIKSRMNIHKDATSFMFIVCKVPQAKS